MAPAIEAVRVLSPLRAGTGNATRVSPDRAGRCPVDRSVREAQRPAPDPAGAKRPPFAGRALAGGFGPTAGPDASVPLWQGRWPLPLKRGRGCGLFRREQETHCVSPARVERCPVDRQVLERQRPAPDLAGAKRPPGAGRALAGGFGPRPVLIQAQRCGRGDGLCQRGRGIARSRVWHGLDGTRVSPACRQAPPPGHKPGSAPAPLAAAGPHRKSGRDVAAPLPPRHPFHIRTTTHHSPNGMTQAPLTAQAVDTAVQSAHPTPSGAQSRAGTAARRRCPACPALRHSAARHRRPRRSGPGHRHRRSP